MKFLIDAQLPPALVKLLVEAGAQAEHVVTIGLGGADDAPIWSYAMANGCVIVSKDEDFALRRAVESNGPAVIWLRIGNCSNRALIRWFAPLVPDLLARLGAGETLIEVT